MRPRLPILFSRREQLWIAVGVAVAGVVMLVVAALTGQLWGAEPARQPSAAPAHTSRRLGGAIDLYLKEVEAAERAKAAAADKLVATYEATIKRAMRAGELRLVEELQAELKEVRAEVEKGTVAATAPPDDAAALTSQITSRPWNVYWRPDRSDRQQWVFSHDGTVIHAGWSKPRPWKIENRPAIVVGFDPQSPAKPDHLFLLPNGELRGFSGNGMPIGGFQSR